MKKLVALCLVVFLLILSGCSLDKKSESSKESSSDTISTSEKAKENISEKDYASLGGTWECLDEAEMGDAVFIERNVSGLTIQYGDEAAVETEFVAKESMKESIYFHFENRVDQVAYRIELKSNGNIVLNRGTTNPEMEGLSKPMEYEKKDELNFTLQEIKEMVEQSEDFEYFQKTEDFDDDYKILAVPEGEGYSFVSGPDNEELAAIEYDESGTIIREYNPSKDLRATTLREVRQLIENIRNGQ